MFKSLPVRDPQHLMLLKWSARGTLKTHSFSSYGDCFNRSGVANPHGCSLSKPFLEEVRQHAHSPAWPNSRATGRLSERRWI
jgi:hypothetical protein